MPSVSILKTDQVTPSPTSNITNFQDKLPLSVLDLKWLRLPHTTPLFLYPNTTVDSFPTILHSLKSSLSKTLTKFYPLAGKLNHVQDTGDIIIDCTDCSVEFVEAECTMDIKQLAENHIHDTVTFLELVPHIDRTNLPIPVTAVKVTRFTGGGMAVGLAIHHAVADGNGKRLFYEAWSAVCRGDIDFFDGMAVDHDRKALKYPNDQALARDYVRNAFPDVPFLGFGEAPMEERLRLQRRTFVASLSAIQSIRKRIMDQLEESEYRMSTFTAMAAYVWFCLARTNMNAATTVDDVTNLLFLVDCRTRVDPPIPGYTGNCLRMGIVEGTWSELRGEKGLSRAQVLIADAIKKRTEGDMFRGEDREFGKFRQIPESGRVAFSRSNRFLCSQTDFGWGKPGRFEMAGMNMNREVMLDGMEGGCVKVSIALEPNQMDDFAMVFKEGLDS